MDQVTLGVVDNIEHLGSIGAVMRLWCRIPANGRMLVEPPKHLGGIHIAIQQVTLNQAIGLLPETDLCRVPMVPSISDDPVSVRHRAGQ